MKYTTATTNPTATTTARSVAGDTRLASLPPSDPPIRAPAAMTPAAGQTPGIYQGTVTIEVAYNGY